MAIDAKQQIQRLKVYVEKCQRDVLFNTNKPHKKAFFEREIAKTNAVLAKLAT